MMVKYFCDKCDKEMGYTSPINKLDIELSEHYEISRTATVELMVMGAMLCKSCLHAAVIRAFINDAREDD